MALEDIKKVALAEQEAEQKRTDAFRESKTLLADAEKAGHELVEKARAQADKKAKQMLAEAEANAVKLCEEIYLKAEKDCLALKEEASKKQPDAAAILIGRIVNGE